MRHVQQGVQERGITSTARRAPVCAGLVLGCAALLGAASVEAADVTGRVVDQKGAPVPDAVVFVQELPPGVTPPPDRPAAIMDQVDKTFVPHVLPVPAGTEVHFPNHDQIHHHVYSFSRTKTFEIPLYKGEVAPPVRFDAVGAVKVGCNIHDWMEGVILVLPTPYFTTTDASGAFTLRAFPPGAYTLAVWHERSKTDVEDIRQRVEVGDATPPLIFTLAVSRPRPTPALRREPGYE